MKNSIKTNPVKNRGANWTFVLTIALSLFSFSAHSKVPRTLPSKKIATKKMNSAPSAHAVQAVVVVKQSASGGKGSGTPGGRAPSSLSSGISDSQKSLEIRGQSRNLSMLLVLKNRHENIDFVKPRDSYHDEIAQTGF